jgi:FkbM family methyltransferase
MPSPRRLAEALLDRRLPLRTRIDLLAADARARRAGDDLLRVRYAPASVYLTRDDYAIDRASFVFAVAEASYAADYRETAVLDVGAHKGYFSAFAVHHGARVVTSYEPESANLAVLERAAADFRAKGTVWTVRSAAVDSEPGRADLHVMDGSWGHALEPPASFSEHEVRTESVEVVALASAIAEASSNAGDRRLVVKLNIEGAECSAVLGTGPEAWAGVDEVFVETHPWATCDGDQLAAHLERAGLRRHPSAHPAVLRMRREAPPRSDPRSRPT